MCGIAGIVTTQDGIESALPELKAALDSLSRRGPDSNGVFAGKNILLGHTRLSIIDTSTGGAQPMTDPSGRYTIVFNGEFFNYREHRDELLRQGVRLFSQSDTEVLLHWYIREGADCLHRINGFFAFAVFDKEEQSLFLARDRMGVKPLWIHQDDKRFLFASELKALMKMGVPREIDPASLLAYLQLNYIPGPTSIFRNVLKLEPGHYLYWKNTSANLIPEKIRYYAIPETQTERTLSYEHARKELFRRMDEAVHRRMISDVPLGAFLSGGIDSSVVVGLAARHTGRLKTFTVGFRDEPLFDETAHAETAAKHFRTDHHVFRLSNDDLFGILFDALDYIDEPFADSSALNVFLLSRETRKHVTVALSGDGADEIFSGYNKHEAEWRIRNKGWQERLIAGGAPVWKLLPSSRTSISGNLFRRLERFAEGASLSDADRYWRWASIAGESEAAALLAGGPYDKSKADSEFTERKINWTKDISGGPDLNDLLRNDTGLVLVNDMLVKTDLMPMANSLEVRTPFLDYTVVDLAFSLPSDYKLDRKHRKKIVRDTFKDLLPEALLKRGKQGFEVPLLKWFRKELRSFITEDLLSEKTLLEQGIFNPKAVRQLLDKLFSNDPGDSAARIWALIVFQYWWKKHMRHVD
jgi:asparagine synthase (glutamine-hydrolysing)